MALQLRKISWVILSVCISAACVSSVSAQKNKKGKETASIPKPEPDSKEKIQAELIEAVQQKIIGNTKVAYTLLETFTKKHPEIAAGHFELAEISVSSRLYTQAITSYTQATILDSKNKWYFVRLAELYDFLKMYKESKDVYKKLAAMYPTELEFALSAVSIAVQQGELTEAIGILDRIESEIGVSESINLEKYRLFMAQKKFPEALKELEKLENKFPGETLYIGMAAEVYYAKGDRAKALDAYQKILQRDSNNTLIHLAIADYYQKEKNLDKAFYHLEKAFINQAVDIDKKVNILLSFLSQAKQSEVHRKEGEKLNKLLTEAHPANPKSWSISGDYALDQKDWRTALDNFMKVIELDASKFIFFRESAQLAIRLEDYNALLKITSTAEELYPLQPEVYLYKGIYLMQTNKLGEASETLAYGKELVIENPLLSSDFLSASGTLSAKENDKTKASESFEKAIQVSPNNYWAYLQYARVSSQDKAKTLIDKSISLAPDYPEVYAAKANILLLSNDLSGANVAIEKAIENGGKQIKSVMLLYADITEKNGNTSKAAQIRAEANAI
jgi:tetratricopeptide (TPR) repeat protein